MNGLSVAWERCVHRAQYPAGVIGAPVFMHQVDDIILQRQAAIRQVRQELLRMEFDHCTNRSLADFAGHLQIVGQKRDLKVPRGTTEALKWGCPVYVLNVIFERMLEMKKWQRTIG